MLQGQFANYGDKMFDKDTAKIVRNHAFWGALIMALPLFCLDWIIYCISTEEFLSMDIRKLF